jgi:DNA-nicking Smr family endonuclease
MKRPLRPEELNLWAHVAATVRPAPGRVAPRAEPMPEAPPARAAASPAARPSAAPPRPVIRHHGVPEPIEPGRMRRLTRERDPHGPRLDLHGLDQDQARAQLGSFLRRAHDDGWRAVLVITGKGSRGDGVLRRMAPEWLNGPDLRHLIAGVSHAHPRHGGQGALYVALKRKPRG